MGWILGIGAFFVGLWLLQMVLYWVGFALGPYAGLAQILILIFIGIGVYSATGKIFAAVIVPILFWLILVISGNGLGAGSQQRERAKMADSFIKEANTQNKAFSPEDWTRYSSSKHGFSARFPDRVTVKHNEPSPLAPYEGSFYSVTSNNSSLLVWIDIRYPTEGYTDIFEILAKKSSFLAEISPGSWDRIGEEEIWFNGIPALIRIGFDSSGVAGSYFYELAFIKDYIGIFHVSSPDEDYAEKVFSAVLQSFRFTDINKEDSEGGVLAQAEPSRCDNCNSTVKPSQAFCHECGQSLH